MRRENRGSSSVVAEPSVFLASAEGYVEEHLELPQVSQGPFQGSGGKAGFPSRHHSGKGPQLVWRGESPGFSRVAVGFHSSYDGNLRDPLIRPQGRQSPDESRGFPRDPSKSLPGMRSSLELRPETQGSSPGPTWISVFLWGIHRGFRPRLVWSYASLLSSLAGKAVSCFLSG